MKPIYIVRYTTKQGMTALPDEKITGFATYAGVLKAAREKAKTGDCYTFSIEADKKINHYSAQYGQWLSLDRGE